MFKHLLDNICAADLKPNTEGNLNIFVFNFLIGCKTYQNSSIKAIHEFPKLCRDLFTNPASKLDHTINYNSLNVTQFMYLIDPQYEFSKPLFLSSGMTHILNYHEDILLSENNKFTLKHSETVESTLHINIYNREISTQMVTDILNFLTPFLREDKHILVNIQDTTSIVCENIFVSNTCKYIHILPPDCLLNTSEVYACPDMTLNNDKVSWMNIRDNKYNLMRDSLYLQSVYRFLNMNYYLPALLSLWTSLNIKTPLFHFMSGEPVEPITNNNLCLLYDSVILPYVKYRFYSSDNLAYILYFINTWKDYYYTTLDFANTVSFEDIIKKECVDILKTLNIKYDGELSLHTLRNIVTKNRNKI